MKPFKFICLTIFALMFNISNAQSGYKVGDFIEDFSLKNVDGKTVSLANYPNAKGFIITFTCNTCPYANMYEQRIMALDKKFAPKGFPVIAIMPNDPAVQPGDSFEAMQQRAQEKGYTFPYLMDEGQTVYPRFGATKTPHNYVVEKTETGLKVRYIGAIDDNYKDANKVKTKYVEQAIEAILDGKDIEISFTRAIGCSIKSLR